jgi:hypothetical protein
MFMQVHVWTVWYVVCRWLAHMVDMEATAVKIYAEQGFQTKLTDDEGMDSERERPLAVRPWSEMLCARVSTVQVSLHLPIHATYLGSGMRDRLMKHDREHDDEHVQEEYH